MVATLKLEGAKELQRKLKRLEQKSVRSVNTKAVREGLKPIASEAKRSAPVGETKRLRKGIGRKTKGYKGGNAIGMVGQRGKRISFFAPHYHLVEFGHRLVKGGTVKRIRTDQTTEKGIRKVGTAGLDRRGARGKGRVIGFVKGKHFMRKALTSKSRAALSAFRRAMAVGIVNEAKKK